MKRSDLIEILGTIEIPPSEGPFVVRDHIRLKSQGGIFSNFGQGFYAKFLDGDGQEERPYFGSVVYRSRLTRKASDTQQGEEVGAAIIPAIGGESWVRTRLYELFWLANQQPNGETGVLLTNGMANIFYIRDRHGGLYAVILCWETDANGWCINASSIKDFGKWDSSSQVFSQVPRGVEV